METFWYHYKLCILGFPQVLLWPLKTVIVLVCFVPYLFLPSSNKHIWLLYLQIDPGKGSHKISKCKLFPNWPRSPLPPCKLFLNNFWRKRFSTKTLFQFLKLTLNNIFIPNAHFSTWNFQKFKISKMSSLGSRSRCPVHVFKGPGT